MDKVADNLEATVASTTAQVSQQLSAIVDSIRSQPLVQQILAHPFLQHPLLQDPKVVTVVAGLLVTLIILALFSQGSKSTSRKGTPTVLFVGPSDSGKTSLFAKLSQDERAYSHTSLVPSVTTVALPSSNDGSSKVVRLVDLAGHARLRDEVGKHITDADAVIFVVDIVALVRNAATVAEELPLLLTKLAGIASRRPLSAAPPKFLLLANKVDLLVRPTAEVSLSPPNLTPTARSTALERVRSILTREMDRLKSARGAGGVGGRIEGMSRVASSGKSWWARLFGSSSSEETDAGTEDDESLIWGGAGSFRWEDVEGVEVAWGTTGLGPARAIGGPVEVAGDGLDELTDFLWDL